MSKLLLSTRDKLRSHQLQFEKVATYNDLINQIESCGILKQGEQISTLYYCHMNQYSNQEEEIAVSHEFDWRCFKRSGKHLYLDIQTQTNHPLLTATKTDSNLTNFAIRYRLKEIDSSLTSNKDSLVISQSFSNCCFIKYSSTNLKIALGLIA